VTTTKQLDETVEINSPKSWEYARSYAALLGDIPSSFSSALRTLMLDFEKRGGSYSPGSRFLALRLLKGKNLKAPFYFACLTYRPEAVEGKAHLTDGMLLDAFKPDEVAAMFSVIYLYKKAKKFCDATEFGFVAPNLHREIEIAGHVGASMPAVGFANSLLAVAMRYIGIMTFLRYNTKHFQEYRRSLKAKKTALSYPDEMDYFGCTDVQVASILLQSAGFGVNFSTNFHGMVSKEKILDKTEVTSSPFDVLRLWTESLNDSGKIPDIVHDIKFYPSKESVARLVERVQGCIANGPKYTWLDKMKDDVNPDSTPQLFDGTKEAPPEKELEAVPEELGQAVSKEDLATIEKETDI